MKMKVAPGEPGSWDGAALQGCLDLKSLITLGNSKLLGFEKPEDASLAGIGQPFDVYTIRLDALRNYKTGHPVMPLLQLIESRVYPLSVRGVVLAALVVEVDTHTNEHLTTAWGLVKLIRLVTKYKDPDFQFLVWIPGLNLNLLGNRLDETMMLIPLATRELYGLVEGTPVAAAVVFALLAQQVKTQKPDDYTPG
jgi:hypothetical protein